MKPPIQSRYFEWLCEKIQNVDWCEAFDYGILLKALHSVTYRHTLPMDKNREVDGIDLRFIFASEHGIPSDEMIRHFGVTNCTMLELMVSLSMKCEDDYLYDPEYGDRTGYWFWDMVESLGLVDFVNSKIDGAAYDHIEYILYNFINGTYEPNGQGGLFRCNDPTIDIRDYDLWQQLMMYICSHS